MRRRKRVQCTETPKAHQGPAGGNWPFLDKKPVSRQWIHLLRSCNKNQKELDCFMCAGRVTAGHKLTAPASNNTCSLTPGLISVSVQWNHCDRSRQPHLLSLANLTGGHISLLRGHRLQRQTSGLTAPKMHWHFSFSNHRGLSKGVLAADSWDGLTVTSPPYTVSKKECWESCKPVRRIRKWYDNGRSPPWRISFYHHSKVCTEKPNFCF